MTQQNKHIPLFHMVLGIAVSFLKPRRVLRTPQKIGKYTLISPVNKEIVHDNFSIGIYSSEKEKVFIKTWSGKIKDFNYYSLQNQRMVNALLSEKLSGQERAGEMEISTPAIKEVIETNQSVSLVFEYIDGKTLLEFPPEFQEKTIRAILSRLRACSKSLTKKEEGYFMRLSGIFYFLSFPLIFMAFVVLYPKKLLVALHAIARSLPSLPELLREPLIIAHRDISPDNILVRGEKIYLIDWEVAALAPESFDPVFIMMNPKFSGVPKNMADDFKQYRNDFLAVRTALYAMINLRNVPELSQKYSSFLSSHADSLWETANLGRQKIIFSNYDDIKNPAYGGGGAFAVHEVAKRMVSTFDITVLTGNYPQAKDEIIDGVSYKRIGPAFFPGPFGQVLFHIVLPFHVLTEKYDLWIESFTPPFSTSFTPIFTRKPVIGLVHLLSGKTMRYKYHIPFDWIESCGLKFYRRIIALTEFSAQQIRLSNPNADIRIIPNGVALPRLNAEETWSKKHISFIGRIDRTQKGLDMLVSAFEKIKQKTGTSLVIAGSGQEREIAEMKKIIARWNLKERISLPGRLCGGEKDAFYRETVVGVMPSRFETLPLVALEMMSYGIPMVVFNIPDFAWIPKDAAVRVKAFDETLYADAILELLKDAPLREKVSRAARLFAEKNSWESAAAKYEKFIQEALNI
ncbi:glycosyltransferase [bacterium]|nr:glycosyltransferase [bacterium]